MQYAHAVRVALTRQILQFPQIGPQLLACRTRELAQWTQKLAWHQGGALPGDAILSWPLATPVITTSPLHPIPAGCIWPPPTSSLPFSRPLLYTTATHPLRFSSTLALLWLILCWRVACTSQSHCEPLHGCLRVYCWPIPILRQGQKHEAVANAV